MEIDEVTAAVRQGLIPAYLYNDAEVFELERARLFGRSWNFLAHESEIAKPNDYVVRNILDDSFLVTRDSDGQIHVMFNMCVHRGMQVCRAERGSARTFRCPYHAWTYRNDGQLAGLPFHADAYGGDAGFIKEGQALLPAPSIAVRNGMIFASLDPDAPDFETWLGDFAFYLDFYTGQSAAGMEFRGPQRWRIEANWKIGAENFMGDSYHTPHTHASVVDIELFGEPKPYKRKEGVLWHAGPGGGTTYKLPAGSGFRTGLQYVGYPDEMIDRMGERLSAPQRALAGESGFMPSAATLFPNLSFVHNWPQTDGEGRITPFISVRLWQPVGPGETEVYSWFCVAADAPDDYKAASYKAYLMCFGSSGMFEQDDVENWVSITTMARGSMARNLLLNNRMGLTLDGDPIVEQFEGFGGPGTAYQGFGEHNQRHWFSMWAELVSRPAPEREMIAFGMGETLA
ncbi:aromatic ring-hydroxylating oxygenase subunit alpha [Candidatus Poriferisodalis sp.]|uniref:aromatic ring-hydroxylating oxygenase subunit alpha n=1 Tax=Candidatus Poriferisodalis sp. TaxID=3101277 RepID=UPI003C6FDE40